MKKYTWRIELSGEGDNENEAWENMLDILAAEGLGCPVPDSLIDVAELDE